LPSLATVIQLNTEVDYLERVRNQLSSICCLVFQGGLLIDSQRHPTSRKRARFNKDRWVMFQRYLAFLELIDMHTEYRLSCHLLTRFKELVARQFLIGLLHTTLT